MKHQLTRDDLYSLEQYVEVRPGFRARVMAHKQDRRVPIGPNITLYFEDAITMQYQIQEMLRIERIFEAEGIQEELDAYNPLIPDGSNWKATLMMEYPDENERRERLKHLLGIEKHVWIQFGEQPRVTPVADEDLDREDEEKTSSVHFLRFEFTPEMVEEVKQGVLVSMGIDHPNYTCTVEQIPENVRKSLVDDLD